MDIKFYVLIIIAWFIFNVVRAVRKANAGKAKNKPNIPPVTSPRNTDFGRALEELFNPSDGKQTVKPVQTQEARPAYTSQEQIIDETEYDSEAMYSKGTYTAYESQESITEVVQNYDIESEGTEQLVTGEEQASGRLMQTDDKPAEFDLKQAVIYSEILRRPYV